MKRHIASRKLVRKCDYCGVEFSKGDVYHTERYVIKEWSKVMAWTSYTCPKCEYKNEQHDKRFKRFQGICNHPNNFIETVWSYIPGECIKEPDYDKCTLCGATLL
jgi:hypothetical protein